jgi:Periplasmic binding proteins and sugar binding domain of LacI family
MIAAAASALSGMAGEPLYAQGADPNAAPNPYKMQENWAQLPEGRKFGAAIKVQVDHSDGKSIWVFDRCGATECTNSTIAILLNPNNPDSEDEAKDVQEAARSLGVQIFVLNAGTENEIDAAFTKLVEQRAGALMLVSDTFFTSQRSRLATLSTYLRIPTLDAVREFTEAGGLVSYGTSGRLSSSRCVRGADSQGRQAFRAAGPAANRVRAGHQSQDRQGARPRLAADAAG